MRIAHPWRSAHSRGRVPAEVDANDIQAQEKHRLSDQIERKRQLLETSIEHYINAY